MHLFEITNGYNTVYKWFNYLKQKGHYIAGYVIMPNHVHVLIAFCETGVSVSTIVANGKRFMAYDLVKKLKQDGRYDILNQLSGLASTTDRMKKQKHAVFEQSFDRKECFSISFMKQKADYIHNNPRKAGIVRLAEDYVHSSAAYYYTGKQGIYPVITYMELQDIDLTLPAVMKTSASLAETLGRSSNIYGITGY